MTPERWQQIREVFDRAVSLPSEERAAYVNAVCANDSDLRREVESLLLSDDHAGTGFLNSPVVDLTHPAAKSCCQPGRKPDRRIQHP